ncbi:hypothetical protein ASZ90_020168 [hydrocarbon metagenome]|uniref:Outer membrane efflux protein n=1 Tax=hydrocarbon metagenome TaxID=938273 RepID=A0A0W8E1L2_9ZZZZ
MYRKRLLSITSIGLLLVLFLSAVTPVAANTDTARELSIEEAVAMALEASKILEKNTLNLESVYDNLQDAQDEWNEAWTIYPDMEQYYVAFLKARYSYTSALTNEQIQKESIALETRSKYYNVMRSSKNLEQKNKELELVQREHYIVQSKYQFGLTDWSDLRHAAASLADAEASVLDAKNSLDSAYRSFNQLIGLDESSTPALTEVPVFTGLEVENVESTVIDIINGSPDIYLSDENIKLLELVVKYTDSSDQDKLNLKLAEISRVITTTESINALINVYNSIVSLEKSYSIEQDKLENAELELKYTKLKNSVGLVSNTEVLNAELALMKQQNNLFAILCQHQLLKIEFEKPWI